MQSKDLPLRFTGQVRDGCSQGNEFGRTAAQQADFDDALRDKANRETLNSSPADTSAKQEVNARFAPENTTQSSVPANGKGTYSNPIVDSNGDHIVMGAPINSTYPDFSPNRTGFDVQPQQPDPALPEGQSPSAGIDLSNGEKVAGGSGLKGVLPPSRNNGRSPTEAGSSDIPPDMPVAYLPFMGGEPSPSTYDPRSAYGQTVCKYSCHEIKGSPGEYSADHTEAAGLLSEGAIDLAMIGTGLRSLSVKGIVANKAFGSLDELGSLRGTGDTVGDLRNISGSSVQDIIKNVPENASVRRLTPVEGGSQVGLEYKWVDDNGITNRLRIHDPDPSAPVGSNSTEGWTARWQAGGKYYDPSEGTFRHQNAYKPASPHFDPTAANNTHIPIQTPSKWLVDLMKYRSGN